MAQSYLAATEIKYSKSTVQVQVYEHIRKKKMNNNSCGAA